MNGQVKSIDRQLIELLQKDALQSRKELAWQLGISVSTARRRMVRLIQDGVFRFTVSVDPNKIGLPITAVIAFDLENDKVAPAMSTLSSLPEIQWAAATMGRFDIIAIGWFASLDSLYEFIRITLTKLEGVRDTETYLSLQVLKRRSLAI